MTDPRTRHSRWRLILGPESENQLGACLGGADIERDEALAFLYDREGAGDRNTMGAQGGDDNSRQPRGADLSSSQLTVPHWINRIHELFPRSAIERLERDALERYQLTEVVTSPELLRRAKPSPRLLEAVLRTKHLMNQEVLALARTLVRKTVDELIEKLSFPVRQPFLGARERRRSNMKVAKNFDWRETIRRNLKRYDVEKKRLVIETPWFTTRVRRQVDRWQIIILVDESGSMLGSVIHAAITASVFFGIPSLRPRLVLFDTAVVDVTEDCSDPVETMMKVQLGGGTDIGQALAYAETLVENPSRTIVVLITDFYEGAPEHRLFAAVKRLVESGVKLLGLAALDIEAKPNYDRRIASRIVALGAEVGAMTPGELALWVAEKVRR